MLSRWVTPLRRTSGGTAHAAPPRPAGVACAHLAVAQDPLYFRRRRPGILHRVRCLPVPELLLDGRNIAGLGNDVLAHGMPRTVRGPPLYLRDATDGIPDRIDHPD